MLRITLSLLAALLLLPHHVARAQDDQRDAGAAAASSADPIGAAAVASPAAEAAPAEAPPAAPAEASPPVGLDEPGPDHPVLRRRSTKRLSAPVALGLELGEASGLSVGYWLRDRQEINGLLGFSLATQALVLRSDYAYHFWRWVPAADYGVQLSFFAGAGLRLGLFEPRPSFLREAPLALGARLPIGVAAALPPLPAELVLDVAPGADLLPEPRFRLEAGLALRFHVDLLTGKVW